MNIRGKVAAAALACAMLSPGVAQAEPLTAAEAQADMNTALRATDNWWKAHWGQVFTGGYRSPRVVGLYNGAAQSLNCGGTSLAANNAWYCGANDYVAFDTQFMNQVFKLGDSFLYLVVAHEWGHAIQARLQSNLRYQAGELQADCFAGAALGGAGRDGTILWEAGDTTELSNSLTAVADDYPWTKVSDHGSASQRVANFSLGVNRGPSACIPS